MERPAPLVEWILASDDPALAYQARRDLLDESESGLAALRDRIPREGWAAGLLGRRRPDGHWGKDAYVPKWTCTHYVLYELFQLELPPDNEACRESVRAVLSYPRGIDGGVNYARTVAASDVCVNGMILSFASHFRADSRALGEIVDYLLRTRMGDGGWNCEYGHGAVKSSLHTTIAVLEGLWTYMAEGGTRQEALVVRACADAVDFILRHRLFESERTGETIADDFFSFRFPVRWKYDILRCLDLFGKYNVAHDPRMDPALDIVEGRRGGDGAWKAASQAGRTYFVMERNGSPGRWNTLRALRVLRRYGRS